MASSLLEIPIIATDSVQFVFPLSHSYVLGSVRLPLSNIKKSALLILGYVPCFILISPQGCMPESSSTRARGRASKSLASNRNRNKTGTGVGQLIKVDLRTGLPRRNVEQSGPEGRF